MAQVGLEPTTDRLTADSSTTELLWINCMCLNIKHKYYYNKIKLICNRYLKKYAEHLHYIYKTFRIF